MNVSVVLCHHRGDFVTRAIETLKQSRGVELEIIVVTSDESRDFPGARTVYHNSQPSEKRNVGFKYCQYNNVAFFDDDVEVDRDCLFELAKVLERPEVGMVYGKTLNMERRQNFDGAGSFLTSTGFLWAREENGIKDIGQYDKEEEVFAGKGACMMIKRKAFVGVHFFDPYYGILAEETDISWKCWLAGYKVIYVPRGILYHAFNTSFKPWNYFYTHKRVFFHGSRNYLVMLTKCLSLKNLILILPQTMTLWFVAGIGMLFKRKWKAGVNILLGILGYFQDLPIIIEKRRRTQALRVVSDKMLFKTILKNPPISFFINRIINYWKTGKHG
jgi:GT2 family glycosyltransferase